MKQKLTELFASYIIGLSAASYDMFFFADNSFPLADDISNQLDGLLIGYFINKKVKREHKNEQINSIINYRTIIGFELGVATRYYSQIISVINDPSIIQKGIEHLINLI